MTRQVELAEIDSVRPLAPQEFEQIRQLAYRTFGLDLKTGKEELVSARLRKLVRGGGYHSFQDYYKGVLQDRTGVALLAMIDALATNHTSFLREPDHFQFLRDQVLPAPRHARPHRDLERGMLHWRGGVDPGHGAQRSPPAPPGPYRRQRHFQ